jgi:hypothetical protein
MRQISHVLLLLVVSACDRSGTIHGLARDGLRGHGLPDVLLVPDTPSENCPPIHLVPDAGGGFYSSVCGSQNYTLDAPQSAGGIHWRVQPVTVHANEDVSLEGWPTATEPGVYVLSDVLTRISPSVAMEASQALPSNTTVRFPLEIPGTVPQVKTGQFLLLQGTEADDRLVRLGASTTPVSFARLAPPTVLGPWWFEGVDISPEGAVTALPAVAPTTTTKDLQGLHVTWISASAVPAGRYLVGKPDQPRAWMVDFVAEGLE